MTNICALHGPLPPGSTIGILGGGQLGRMLALAAARLGLKAHIYSDEPDAPAFQVAAARTHAAYDDSNALRAFAASCDAVTFEFENVPSATVALLARAKPANPKARALEVAQERFAETSFVAELGLKTAAFARADNPQEARDALKEVGAPAILKTRRMGYDGKGQAKVVRAEDLDQALECLKGAPAILESFVEFDFEASVIAARGADGSFAAYDPPENQHAHHILKRSTVPGRPDDAQADRGTRDRADDCRSARLYRGAVRRIVRDEWTARCSSMRSRRACTIPVTGRWKPAPSASSSNISAPSQAGRSATLHVIPMR